VNYCQIILHYKTTSKPNSSTNIYGCSWIPGSVIWLFRFLLGEADLSWAYYEFEVSRSVS
jgi:hypothetical protein